MIISLDIVKAFDKTQQLFMIKVHTDKKQRSMQQCRKTIYSKDITTITMNVENHEHEEQNKDVHSFHTHLVQYLKS